MRVLMLVITALIIVAILGIVFFLYVSLVGNTQVNPSQPLTENLYTNPELGFSVSLPEGWKPYEVKRGSAQNLPSVSIFASLIAIPETPGATKQQLIILWDSSLGASAPTQDDTAFGVGVRDLVALTKKTVLRDVVNSMTTTVGSLLGDTFKIDGEFPKTVQGSTEGYFIKYVLNQGDKKLYGQSLFAIKSGKLYELSWLSEKPVNSLVSQQIFDSFRLQ